MSEKPYHQLSAEEIVISKDCCLTYNLEPIECTYAHLMFKNERVTTSESIPKGTPLYMGDPVLSYKRHHKETSHSLLFALSSLTPTILAGLMKVLRPLTPHTVQDIMPGLKILYPRASELDLNEIISDNAYEHIIQVYLLYNQFSDPNKDEKYMYFKGSRFNHSCSPNCRWLLLDGVIHISSTRNIAQGEEVTISYWNDVFFICDPLIRRTFIVDRGHFLCKCAYCISNTNELRCCSCGINDTVFWCKRCKQVCYCSKQCQTMDWKRNHKVICDVIVYR
jgi:hypothetical protein